MQTEMATMLESFYSPPTSYRPSPLLVLNDEHEGRHGEQRLTTMLEQYSRVGFGGAFLHPRPGLITEYLSSRWFDLVRHAVQECSRLDLKCYLYDENSYPSGVGGGHVPAAAPEARTQYVKPVFGTGPSAIPENVLALHTFEANDPGRTTYSQELGEQEQWVGFVMESMQPVAWHGDTPTPSLLDPRTTEVFLTATHEAYERELGDLFSQVPAIFSDEPQLPAQGHGPWSEGLHLTPYVLGQFRFINGYDLRPHIASLFYDVDDYRRVRFDYYELIHKLWIENWALPMERWCEEKGIALTGHYLEHDWPCPYATPGHVHLLAHMHWPGTDMLQSFLLDGHVEPDVQNFYPTEDGREPHGLMYLRQVHSIANQLDKERVIDECWGAGGHDSTPADWLRIGRWLIVHGVNLLVPHISMSTIRGTRKSDHPQFFSDHSPWFEQLRPMTYELSRLSWASNQGRVEQRVLVLDPLTTGYCVSRKADCLSSDSQPGHSAAAPPSAERFRRALASVTQLQQEFAELTQSLSDRQVDFDLGDEYVLEEHGSAEHGKLKVGSQEYELMIWPPLLTNLRSGTTSLLRNYLQKGGVLLGVRPREVTVDGLTSDFLQRLEEEYPDSCKWFGSMEELIAAVIEQAPPRLRAESPPISGLAHMRRVVDDSEIFIVVNSSENPVDSPVKIETSRSNMYELDPKSGGCYPMEVKDLGGCLGGRLELPARGSTVLLATDQSLADDSKPVAVSPVRGSSSQLELKAVRRSEPNVLVIDHCELELPGEAAQGTELVYDANKRFWSTYGLDTNGWMATIQYRDQILARNRYMPSSSGGTVHYRFQVRKDTDTSTMELAIETPELWEVEVNGYRLDASRGRRWLDDHIQATPITDYVGRGENVVTLRGVPFDVRREIDQIYLLGEFSCVEANPGFNIEPQSSLGLGSWRSQGLPFYDREMLYDFELPDDKGEGILTLNEKAWHGSILIVEQAGKIVGKLWEPPYRLELAPSDGTEVTLRVIGLPKNLLGPLHDAEQPRGRAWIPMWHGTGVRSAPRPGREYDLLDLGMFETPTWLHSSAE